MPYTCDGTRVGVLIYDQSDRLLMTTGATGLAPATRHAQTQRPTYLDAALAACQEVGLTAGPEDLKRVYILWHPDRCAAETQHPSGGHDVQVYYWQGSQAPAEDQAAGLAWYTPAQVQALGERTLAYAQGRIGEQEWQADPGMDLLWVDILTNLEPPYDPNAHCVFDNVVQTRDWEAVRAVRRLYGAPAPDSGLVVKGTTVSYTDPQGRTFSLDREELTVAEEACTHRVQASVSLPEPREEAALPLVRAVLAAMGLDADYELVEKAS